MFLRIAPMIFIMGAIFFLSHQSGDDISLPSFDGADKIVHFIAYSVLACTIVYAHKIKHFSDSKSLVCIVVVIVCFLYGVSDEFHQSFIEGRVPSFSDIVADTLGGIFIAVVLFVWPMEVSNIVQRIFRQGEE